jgi:hypothetical protein
VAFEDAAAFVSWGQGVLHAHDDLHVRTLVHQARINQVPGATNMTEVEQLIARGDRAISALPPKSVLTPASRDYKNPDSQERTRA